jgi:hypothetical protein
MNKKTIKECTESLEPEPKDGNKMASIQLKGVSYYNENGVVYLEN